MNTLRYAILWAAVAVAAMAGAETLEQLKARMLQDGAANGVIAVGEENGQRGTFMPSVAWGGLDLYYCRLVWLIDEGETIKKESKDVLIIDAGKPGSEEVIGWLGEQPAFMKPAQAADPLGTDREILTAVGGNIVKAEITRHPVVGDVAPSATVYGYREIEGKPVEFKVVVYRKGDVLVSNEPTDKAAASADVKAP